MAGVGLFACSECGMFSLDPFATVSDNGSDGVYERCQLISSLVAKVESLERRVHSLLRDREMDSVVAVDAPGRVSVPRLRR